MKEKHKVKQNARLGICLHSGNANLGDRMGLWEAPGLTGRWDALSFQDNLTEPHLQDEHHLATCLLQSCSIPRPHAKIKCAFSKQMRWAEEWVQHSTPQLPEEMGFELEDLNSTQSWTEELGTERMKLKHFNAAWHLNLQISLWLCINNTYTEVNSNKNKQKKKQQLSMSCQ